tara:strand:+ start:174 stop:527 length:354 start_codon:yes stop_codon:yes gene_type:complete
MIIIETFKKLNIPENAWVSIQGEDYSSIVWTDKEYSTESEWNDALKFVKKNKHPMILLRAKRDKKLAETDWWGVSDRGMTQEQKKYRQKLRDLPATASPSLDEDGNLSGVSWPEKPE